MAQINHSLAARSKKSVQDEVLGPAEFSFMNEILVTTEEFMLRRWGRGAFGGERAGILKESCRHVRFNHVGVIKGNFSAIVGGSNAREDSGACILRRPVVGRPDEPGPAIRKAGDPKRKQVGGKWRSVVDGHAGWQRSSGDVEKISQIGLAVGWCCNSRKAHRCGQSKQGGQSKTVRRQKRVTVPALPRKDVWLGSA